MTKNIFSNIGSHNHQQEMILACRNHLGNALELYAQSPAHTHDIIKGKWHLAQQISRVRKKAIKEFSERLVDKMDLAKMQVSREYMVRHLRLWLCRQPEISGLTTHSLTSIGPNDIST